MGRVQGQQTQENSLLTAQAVALYHQALGRNAPLYSGVEYVGHQVPMQGHPFFLTREWQRGRILFDGILYQDVPMLYDVAADVLVIGYAEETDPIVKLTLVPDKVTSFTLPQHRFVHLQDSSGSLKAGFYEQLYQGKAQVVAKRSKNTLMRPGSVAFYDADKLYLYKDGRYHAVKSKGSVLNVFKDRKKELTAYLRGLNINFNEQRERALVSLAQRYDQLTTAK